MPLSSTLPRLRHHFTSGRELDERDEGVHLLLEAGLYRDWQRARRAVKASRKTPEELFWELSKKRKPDWRKRLHHWIIYMFGGYPYDPHARELYDTERRR